MDAVIGLILFIFSLIVVLGGSTFIWRGSYDVDNRKYADWINKLAAWVVLTVFWLCAYNLLDFFQTFMVIQAAQH